MRVRNIDYVEVVSIIAPFAAIFISLQVWILTQITKLWKPVGKLSEDVGRIDERLKNPEKNMDRWQSEMRDEFVRMYEMSMPKKVTGRGEKGGGGCG